MKKHGPLSHKDFYEIIKKYYPDSIIDVRADRYRKDPKLYGLLGLFIGSLRVTEQVLKSLHYGKQYNEAEFTQTIRDLELALEFLESPDSFTDDDGGLSTDLNRLADCQRTVEFSLKLVEESMELAQQLVIPIIMNKPRDENKITGELGDVYHFVAMITEHLGRSPNMIRGANADKVTVRFSGGYTDEKAINRADEK